MKCPHCHRTILLGGKMYGKETACRALSKYLKLINNGTQIKAAILEICSEYHVTRKTIYNWIGKYTTANQYRVEK